MKIYSKDEAKVFTGGMDITKYCGRNQYSCDVRSFRTPIDTGSKTQLARYLAKLYLRHNNESAILLITGWSSWPSQSNFNLFDGYRASLGENRSLIDSPVHYFSASDFETLFSILGMCLYFYWDADLVGTVHDLRVHLSNDGFIDISTADPQLTASIFKMLPQYGSDPLAESTMGSK
jgi:hypothetical protein